MTKTILIMSIMLFLCGVAMIISSAIMAKRLSRCSDMESAYIKIINDYQKNIKINLI